MGERTDLIQTGVPEGLDALVLARLVDEAADGAQAQGLLVHITRDDRRLDELEQQLKFFAPKVRVVSFPAWDTVPYDRVGPNADIVAKRITALSRLVLSSRNEPVIVLTTVNAVLQRVPPRTFIRNSMKSISPGQRVDMNRLIQRLQSRGLYAHRHRHGAGRICGSRRHRRRFPARPAEPGTSRFLRRQPGKHQGLRRRDAAHGCEAAAQAHRHAGVGSCFRRGADGAVPHPLRGVVRRRHRRRSHVRGRERRLPLFRPGALAAAVPRTRSKRCSTTCRAPS